MKFHFVFWVIISVLVITGCQPSIEDGLSYYTQGNYNMAVDHFKKMLSNNNDVEPVILLCMSLREIGQHTTIIETCEKLLNDDKISVAILWEICMAYMATSNTNRFVSCFRKMIKTPAKNVWDYIALGMAYEFFCLPEYAENYYTIAIQENQNLWIGYYKRGVLKYKMQKTQDAIDDLNLALEVDGKSVKGYYMRGLIKMETGKYEDAIEDFTSLLQINPLDSDGYYNRGLAYGLLREYKKSISDFSKTISLNKTHTNAYYNRGLTYGLIGEYEKAIQDFTKAITLDPNFRDAYYNRAISYARIKEKEKAYNDFKVIMALDKMNKK